MKKRIRRTTVLALMWAVGCGGSGTGGTGGSSGTGTGGTLAQAGSYGSGGATGGTAGSATGGAAGGGSGGAAGGDGRGGVAGGAAGNGGQGGVASGGGMGGANAWLTPPDVPPALAVPAGAMLKIHDHGSGVQIYTCTTSGGGDAGATTYTWTLKGPDAELTDAMGTQVGTHGIGPEWTSNDGSVVNGTKVQQANAPSTGAIPWLLLRASSTSGTGAFSNITYVQRVNTSGGVAPATGCVVSTVGTNVQVDYSADYYFYTGGAGSAWLVPPANLPLPISTPAGTTAAIYDRGIGTQIYTCTASGGGDASAVSYGWVLKGPNAILYDATFTQVGTHGIGPEWTSVDGSIINGTKIAQASATVSTAIPWLLLKATASGPTGAFTSVTYVQRLNTAGGVAPATGCNAGAVNMDTSVAYSADYYFFTGTPADGGTGG